MTLLVVLIALVVVAIAVVAAVQSSRRRDGVDSFRRQIDALSPEARRPVVDQVQNAADRRDEPDVAADHGSREHDDGDGASGEDGARGA